MEVYIMAINFELNRISIDDYTLVATDDAQNITISFAIQNLRTDAEPEDYFRGETDTVKAYDPEDKERLDMQFNTWLYDYDAETVEEVVEHLKTAFIPAGCCIPRVSRSHVQRRIHDDGHRRSHRRFLRKDGRTLQQGASQRIRRSDHPEHRCKVHLPGWNQHPGIQGSGV